jgi:hypothetical protein
MKSIFCANYAQTFGLKTPKINKKAGIKQND